MAAKDDGTRSRILRVVEQTPGLNIQEIAQETGLARTSVVYHMRRLVRERQVSARRQAHHRLHFPSSMDEFEKSALTALRVPSIRIIIETVFFNDGLTRRDLENRLNLTPRTVRRAFKRLTGEGLAETVRVGSRKSVVLQLNPRLRALLGRNKHLLGSNFPSVSEPEGLKAWLLVISSSWRNFLSPW